jgi:predicted RecB family nuclease
MSEDMFISEHNIKDYLDCPMKPKLRASGIPPSDPELGEYSDRIIARFRSAQRAAVEARWRKERLPMRVSTVEAYRRTGAKILFDCPIEAGQIRTVVHGIERILCNRSGTPEHQIPIRFVSRSKTIHDDRILLAFDALAIATETGQTPRFGWLIYGQTPKFAKISMTASMLRQAKSVMEGALALPEHCQDDAPAIGKQCADCEFRTHCRDIAKESDDLALILGMSTKEKKRLHAKGIFTVNQLSYTFRLRRCKKNSDSVYNKRHHALTALAIHQQKIYVLGEPRFDLGHTPVYLDVEGIPDLESYYLIGASYFRDGELAHVAFWADDSSEESVIWKKFLAFLTSLDNPTLVHYGGYEKQFLRNMAQRYPDETPDQTFVGRLIEKSCNILSTVFSHVYFPAYSNGLKDVVRFLGYVWADPTMSGALASIRRLRWEQTKEPQIKQGLIEYNADDCRALVALAKSLSAIVARTPQPGVVPVSTAVATQTFYRKGFAIPEFAAINEAAYWDHQRDLVYVRSSRRQRRPRRKAREKGSRIKPNRTLVGLAPSSCSVCGCTRFKRATSHARVLYDIKFTERGLRRDVVRYNKDLFRCRHCGERVSVHPDPWPIRKYGHGFMAYVVYLLVELCLLLRPVARHLNETLGFSLGEGVPNYIRRLAAQDYRDTYERIKQSIVRSYVAYADETNAELRDGTKGYVWVVATDQEVVYFFTKSRECDRVKEILSGFTGVLVTDFYAGYDSIPCPQQKCLIHLMRDLNDELLKQPFNEELKELGTRFGLLLRPIIATIDSLGLARSAMKEHLPQVDRFQKWMDDWKPASEVCVKYQARFQGSRDRLFTFLAYDGVAWNNNNAEHAIKEFGRLRAVIDGLIDEDGLGEYLILLSVSVTCKYRDVSPLGFLRSGEKDIDVFCAGHRHTTRRKR